jgi:hypothetical protein
MHIRTHPEINELSPPSMLQNPAISLLCQVRPSEWGELPKFGPTIHFLRWAGPYFGNVPHHHLGLTYHQKENEENNDKHAIHPCLVK